MADVEKEALVCALRHYLLHSRHHMGDLSRQLGLLPRKKRDQPDDDAHHLRKFLSSMHTRDQELFDTIKNGFREIAFKDGYMNSQPRFIQIAIGVVYGEPLPEHDRYDSATKIISQSQESDGKTVKYLNSVFQGLWDIVRFSHDGNYIVRAAMQVTPSESSPPSFEVYFRTSHQTAAGNTEFHKTSGKVLSLVHREHVMFLGQEQDGFPLTILCPFKALPSQPFYGIVQRRHHGNRKVFAAKAHFSRCAAEETMDTLQKKSKIGTWSDTDPSDREAVSIMRNEITGLDRILEHLKRRPDDLRSGIVLDDD